ncbi:MAG: ABC transporter permease [Microbacteriaceae bacterium]|nr:ABC transporter permease [Microbacteriaceae bacterium]MCL2796094.1 ABC transporter permease [Microbacteriaceae bacterium]
MSGINPLSELEAETRNTNVADATSVLAGLTTHPRRAKRRRSGGFNVSGRFWVAAALVGFVILMAFIGPLVYPFGAGEKVGGLYDNPSATHLLGTDNFGHDVISVLMTGARNSLYNGLVAGLVATAIGVAIGVLAGYVGGWLEELLMGITNVVLAVPAIVVLILISISLQNTSVGFLKGIMGLALVIGFTSWPWTARAVRAQASSVATREHIDIAKLSGARTPGILWRDVLPYLASYIVMAFVLQVAGAILAEASLSMLGLGPSDVVSLGVQLHWAIAFQAVGSGAWWAFLPPTIILTLVSFGLLLLQSSLDELFNPRLRRGKRKAMKAAAERRAAAAAQLQTQPAGLAAGAEEVLA